MFITKTNLDITTCLDIQYNDRLNTSASICTDRNNPAVGPHPMGYAYHRENYLVGVQPGYTSWCVVRDLRVFFQHLAIPLMIIVG